MFNVRKATLADLPCFEPIEVAAGQLFPAGRLPDEEDVVPLSDYLPSLEQGWLWIAEVAGSVVGFIWCIAHDEVLHLQQISVHPDQGRRGIGRKLVEDVISVATERGIRTITLTTFADLAWNAPFYRSAGFENITAVGLYPHVDSALGRERSLGMTQRIGMVRNLTSARQSGG